MSVCQRRTDTDEFYLAAFANTSIQPPCCVKDSHGHLKPIPYTEKKHND